MPFGGIAPEEWGACPPQATAFLQTLPLLCPSPLQDLRIFYIYFILCSFPCSRALRGSSGFFASDGIIHPHTSLKPRCLSFPLYSKLQPASAIYTISLKTPLMSYNPTNSLHQCNLRLTTIIFKETNSFKYPFYLLLPLIEFSNFFMYTLHII